MVYFSNLRKVLATKRRFSRCVKRTAVLAKSHMLSMAFRAEVEKLLVYLGNQLTPVRHDRDDFIRVNEENILPNMKNNFEKRTYGDAGFHTGGSVDPKHTPYDVLSVIV